jgi:hypothetical protein
VAPEPRERAVEGVGGEQRAGLRPGVVKVLEDNDGLRERAAAVDEHGHLLVDGVVAQQLVALVPQVLLHVVVLQALEPQRQLHAVRVRARPRPEQHQRGCRRRYGALGRLLHGSLSNTQDAPCFTSALLRGRLGAPGGLYRAGLATDTAVEWKWSSRVGPMWRVGPWEPAPVRPRWAGRAGFQRTAHRACLVQLFSD